MLMAPPTRRTQPYRDTMDREASPVLSAMLAGRDFWGYNPMDSRRALAKRAKLSQLLSQRFR